MTDWIISIMEQLGYFGIALLMFLDNVFPPIPSEVIMPSAGFAASKGQLLLSGVIIAGSFGSLLAAALLYWVGRKIPNQSIFNWVDRYGKYLFIKSEDVKKALDWFEKYGHRVVFFGRMVPAVRSLISIPAGMSHMPFWKFMLYSSVGTIIWTTFLACVGYYFGNNIELMQQIFSRVGYVIIVIVLILVAYFFYKKSKAR
ncbi:membrane protein DedA with SNARE-associated domain [Acinetobacter sp. BIGb0196]|jgi:membrane protein DedA with SNARE-associated domain|nr:membrane protein DedA with SNARE-associated domain [Acinetobacter guillouiae]MCW2249704.1 membrane protein DedA with SNARE-associated domain [Acinetobacter sp. BIGb0204]NII38808.1 membrane protein DedA with SNARE-associated domain [Acinetobacter sp. BIGb0196]